MVHRRDAHAVRRPGLIAASLAGRTAAWFDRLQARPFATLGGTALALLPWALLGPPLVSQAAVATGRLGPPVAIWIVALTPHWLLLPVASLMVAAWRRRPVLGVAAGLVGIAHVALLWPAFAAAGPATPPADAPRLRVSFANVYADNPRPADAVAAVLATHPDVVILAEADPDTARLLEQAGGAELPYAVPTDVRANGFVIRSRYPVSVPPAYRPRRSPDFVVDLAGTPVRVVGVHTRSPITGADAVEWKAQLAKLWDQLWTDSLPMLVIGDFNATRWHPPYRRLASVLDDVHDRLGQGLTASYPADRWYPRILRIDHALTRGLTALGIDDIDVPGSDHLGMVTDLAVTPALA